MAGSTPLVLCQHKLSFEQVCDVQGWGAPGEIRAGSFGNMYTSQMAGRRSGVVKRPAWQRLSPAPAPLQARL